MSELSKTLAMLGMLAPLGASAMGIGDIRSHSALNQALSAEIPLVLSGADKLETIQVRLASPEAFDKAGVERPPALTQLRFKPVARQDGRFVIEVSSREVIQEPFLDFLVEVESPQGTLLREFTLLLDPPREINQAYFGRYTAPYVTAPRQVPEFDRGEPDYASRTRTTTPPDFNELDPAPYAQPAITPEQLTTRTYGPVQRGETLINIASRLERPEGVSARHMANALYLANPQAFSGSMHGLLAGSVLRIPIDDFIGQAQGQGVSGRSAAYRRPPAVGHGDSVGAVADVSARIPSALKRENEELRVRLTQLEQRLEEARRMLELKNAELATLQHHHAETPAAMEDSAQQSDPPAAESPDTTRAEIAPAPPPAPAPVSAPLPTAQTRPTVAPLPQAAPAPEEHSLAPGLWLAGVGLTLLGLGAWLYRRRQLSGETGAEPIAAIKIPAAEPAESGEQWQDPLATPMGFSPPAYAMETPVLETSALDPLWEADIYLRYGRFSQAESLIREAIGQHPEQHDLKRKLFEILGLANNPEGFKTYALELQAGGLGLPTGFWAEIDDLQPGWLPQEILSGAQAPGASMQAKPAPLADAETDSAPIETLDIEDTDFTAELRALEEQYAHQSSGTVEAADAMSQAVSASPPSLTVSGLPEADSAAGDQDAGITGLDISDTDFSEELRALEAQYSPEIDDRNDVPAEPIAAETAPAGEVTAAQPEIPDHEHLVEFLPPTREELQSASQSRREPATETTLDNLIDFDASSGLAPVRTRPATNREEEPTAAQTAGSAEQDDLFEIPPLKGLSLEDRNSRFGALDFELELFDPSLAGLPGDQAASGAAMIELARRHAEKGEKAAAREALQKVLRLGTPAEKSAAEQLLSELAIVRLSLVPPVPRDVHANAEQMVLPRIKPNP